MDVQVNDHILTQKNLTRAEAVNFLVLRVGMEF